MVGGTKPNTLLITGSAGLLASQIAGRLLCQSNTDIVCAIPPRRFEQFLSLVRLTISALSPEIDGVSLTSKRVQRADPSQLPLATAAYHFSPLIDDPDFGPIRQVLKSKFVTACNYIVTPHSGGTAWWLPRSLHTETSSLPNLLDEFPIVRIFQTSMTISANAQGELTGEGFLHVLKTLNDLKSEIEERVSHYFDYLALRCPLPTNAVINLIRTEVAADLIVAVASQTSSGQFVVASPENAKLGDVLEEVGAAYGVSLLAECDPITLNAVDRLFSDRLTDLRPSLMSFSRFDVEDTCRIADMAPSDLIVDEKAQRELFASVRTAQELEYKQFRMRAASFPATCVRNELVRDASPLIYYSTKPAKTNIIMLNALGQQSNHFVRLIECMRSRFRILIWDPRGIDSGPQPFTLNDHVNDLAAIVDHEHLDQCHLVAWCTAPKVALSYYLRHPDKIQSMIFLNPTLKCTGSSRQFDTPYESNFESLCRVLEEKPGLAMSVMNSLASSFDKDDIDFASETCDEEGMLNVSRQTVEAMNRDLKHHVLYPFRNPESLLRYSRQVMDFWSYDIRKHAPAVKVPVLLMSCQHDRVAASEASHILADILPNSRWIHIPGATHYFLYDRPDVTAQLIESFLDNLEAATTIFPVEVNLDETRKSKGDSVALLQVNDPREVFER